MKKYKIAAILMIIHGGFMELGGIFAMIPALLIGTDKYDIGQYFEFKLPYFQDNLYMMMVMGAIYGVFRLIGLWGQRHKQYLKEHKHFLYTTMLIEGTLNSYLADIDKQAQERLLLLTKQIAEQENVTEQLKADNAMLWVQKMNEIQSRVREIIYNEIIYA